MAFTNLYSKSTANPKDIDFARIGTVVKNKIPDAAIKAFNAKFPKPLPKPFDFAFDTDRDTGKLQITVKKAGADFVFGWSDAEWAQNKAKMKVVETEIQAWQNRIDAALQSLARQQGPLAQVAAVIDALETAAAANAADASHSQQVDANRLSLRKITDEVNGLRTQTVQFWNSGPNQGVLGLIKKHNLPADKLGEERNQAFADYKTLQLAIAKFQEHFEALGHSLEALQKRHDKVGVEIFGLTSANRDRKSELEMAVVEIQKAVGEVQGYTSSDFEGVKAREVLKEAKEFAAKSGAAWTKLSASPPEIDKTIARNNELFARMRILGGRVEQIYNSWQKIPVAKHKSLEKFQGMLKMVRDEYMVELNTLQNTLRSYTEALTKYKPKAVALVEKATRKKK